MDLVSSGIAGLDEMLGGGIPRGHTVAVMGACGTGKTTFGLQFLWEGLSRGEKGIYITMEEDVESIHQNALGFGWDIRPAEEEDRLSTIKLEPADAKSTVMRIKSELPTYIKKFGAERIVVDSVTLLGMMFPDPVERRTHLFDMCQQIKSTGATAILTAEVKDENPKASKDGLVEYLSDGVILLRFEENPETRETQLLLQIVKMRRTGHSRRIKPYTITEKGIVVHREAEVF